MKIHSLKMENWRSFYGKSPEIIFATDVNQNVTVIHAANRAGKTAIMNSMLWLFSGKTSPRFKSPEKLIHWKTLDESTVGESVECFVEVVFEHHGQLHRATRTASYKRLEKLEDSWSTLSINPIKLMRQTETGAWINVDGPQDVLDFIIPPAVRDFFFFDGESLNDKFDNLPDTRKALANQMREFFHLDVYGNTIKAFGSAKQKLLKNLKNSENSDDAKLAAEQEQLERQLTDAEEQVTEESRRIRLANDLIAAAEKKLVEVREARAQQLRRQELDEQIVKLNDAIDGNRVERAEEITRNAYKAFIHEPLTSFFEYLDAGKKRGEVPSNIKRPFVQQLLNDDTCICGRPIKADPKADERVRDWLERGGLSEMEERALRLDGTLQNMRDDIPAFFDRLDRAKKERATMVEDIQKAQREIESISESLLSHDDDYISQVETSIQEERENLQKAQTSQGRLLERKETLIKDIQKKQIDRDSIVSDNKNAERAKNREKYCRQALECLERLLHDQDRIIRQKLSARITRRYKEILEDEHEISIDEQYQINRLKKEAGIELPLSGGQQNALGLAFVGSLAEIQKGILEHKGQIAIGNDSSKFCVVMDSPYGVFDHTAQGKISSYIPSVTDQVIVLVTDSQWSSANESAMRNRISKQYVLCYHATPGEKKGNIGSSKKMTVAGREFDLVRSSDQDYSWTDIIAVE